MDGSTYHQDLAAIRSIVETTDARVEQLTTRQDALVQTVEGLAAAVDKLNTSFSTIKGQLAEISSVGNGGSPAATEEDVDELRRMVSDVAGTMGAAVLNVHRDFAIVLRQVGPAFEQVQRTVGPFAAVVTEFSGAGPPVQAHTTTWSDGGQPQQQNMY